MIDGTYLSISLPPTVQAPAGSSDLLERPRARSEQDDDRFGPAVVIGPSARPPAIVLYDAQGRLTTAVPSDATSQVMPPARIAVDDADAAHSVIYVR